MSEEPEVFIRITFKYLDPKYGSRTGDFNSSFSMDDIKRFLYVVNWEDYRCIHGRQEISPYDSFSSYANGEDEITIWIVKKQPARTKLTNYTRPKSSESEEEEPEEDSEQVITIYVD